MVSCLQIWQPPADRGPGEGELRRGALHHSAGHRRLPPAERRARAEDHAVPAGPARPPAPRPRPAGAAGRPLPLPNSAALLLEELCIMLAQEPVEWSGYESITTDSPCLREASQGCRFTPFVDTGRDPSSSLPGLALTRWQQCCICPQANCWTLQRGCCCSCHLSGGHGTGVMQHVAGSDQCTESQKWSYGSL